MALPMSFIALNLLFSSSFGAIWGNAQSIDQTPKPLMRPSANFLKEYFTCQDYINLAVREGFITARGGVTMGKTEGKLLNQVSTVTAFQAFTITRELQQDKGLLVPAKARQATAPLLTLADSSSFLQASPDHAYSHSVPASSQ